MYKCYRLPCDEELENLINKYEKKGEELMEDKKSSIRNALATYVRADKTIDFTSIEKDWFPTVEADVFISHSHKDMKTINALAGWLNEKFKVEVFIDSYIWEYCDDLLREIDEEYCKQPNSELFDYNKRNFSTTHVHLTLSSALTKMINNTECVIFVETENSVSLKNDIDNNKFDEIGTNSAWIYSELLATSMLGIKIPERLVPQIEKRAEEYYSLNEGYMPLFRHKSDHLIPLSAEDLNKIGEMNLEGDKQYLDELYSTVTKEKKALNE